MAQTDLIINYLPQTLTDEEFKSMFLSIGPVKSCNIVRDRATNYSYGFGFVDYKDPDHARRAIETLNGLQLQNKRIKVAYSRKGEKIKGANLYIRGLPKTMTQDQLSQLFNEYGKVINARVLVEPTSGLGKGVGFVLFNSRDEALAAISGLTGYVPEGGVDKLNIRFAEENAGKARAPPVMVVNQVPAIHSSPGGWGGGYGSGSGGYGGPVRGQGRASQRYNPMGTGGGSGGYSNNSAMQVNTGDNVTLFVYNIGPSTEERALWQLFASFGNVIKVNVIRDHAKGEGKGYGFVTMTNYTEAQSAINSLNGYRYYGRPLQVSIKQ